MYSFFYENWRVILFYTRLLYHPATAQAEHISAWLDQKWFTVTVFLDISKGYNWTWQTQLIYKLIHMFLGGLMKIIDFYLAYRSFRVKMNEAVLEWKLMSVGVSQHSTLFPMLYNLYTSDIDTEVYPNRTCLCGWLLYIYHQNKSPWFAHLAVQRHLVEIGRWSAMWHFNISGEKTNAVVFSRKSDCSCPNSKLKILRLSIF